MAKATGKGERFADQFQLDTNPKYLWDYEVVDQHEYVNPVHANSHLARLANLHAFVTKGINAMRRERTACKKRKRELENAVAAIERQILRANPPRTQIKVKTLKLQDAYIAEKAEEMGLLAALQKARGEVEANQDRIDELDLKIENAYAWLDTIKSQGENLRSFMSTYKDERNRAERHGGA